MNAKNIMKILRFSYLLIYLLFLSSKISSSSIDIILQDEILLKYAKYQVALDGIEQSIALVDQDEKAVNDSLKCVHESLSDEVLRPISLSYAVNLLRVYKQFHDVTSSKYSHATADLEASLLILEQSGLTSSNFFYKYLTPVEHQAYQTLYNVCHTQKVCCYNCFNNSILAMNFQLKNIMDKQSMLQCEKKQLLQVLQDYDALISCVDKQTSVGSPLKQLHQDCDIDDFTDQYDSIKKIQSLYRMWLVKKNPEIKKLYTFQELSKNVVQPLLYEIVDNVEREVKMKDQAVLQEKKDAYDLFCQQQMDAIRRKDIENQVVSPILQAIFDKSFILIDQLEDNKRVQADPVDIDHVSNKKISKKKRHKSKNKAIVNPVGNDSDSVLDELSAHFKDQEEFQNVWISYLDIELRECVEKSKTNNTDIVYGELCTIIKKSVEALNLSDTDSARLALVLWRGSVSLNASVNELKLSEDKKIDWLKDHHPRDMKIIHDYFDKNKNKFDEYQTFHLSTLFSYLIFFVHQSFDVDLNK